MHTPAGPCITLLHMSTTEVVFVSVPDGTDEVEHFWEVSDLGAFPFEGPVCGSGGVSRVSMPDG